MSMLNRHLRVSQMAACLFFGFISQNINNRRSQNDHKNPGRLWYDHQSESQSVLLLSHESKSEELEEWLSLIS